MSTKENIVAIKLLQEYYKTGQDVKEKDLKNIGVDTAKRVHQFRNLSIEKSFLGDWNAKLVDETKDLDGNPIKDNKKLVQRIKALYENGTNKINFSDFFALNIHPTAKEILIENLRLKNYSDFLVKFDYYEISIVDKNKSIEGLWIDKAITTERVLDALHKFEISEKELSLLSEVKLNKSLEDHFKLYFEYVKKSGTSNKGLIDLLLGSNQNYAIELKLARELKKPAESQRAIGQVEQYMKQFRSNFLVIIAGPKSEKKEKYVQDLITKVKDSKGFCYFMEAD